MNTFSHEVGRESADPFVLWGRILLDDPGASLNDLLSGRGARGSQQRAELEDFLADLLTHPVWRDEHAKLIEGLDEALLGWIVERFRWSPADVDAFGARAYAAQLSDSLKIAARLPLKKTAQQLIRDHFTWDNRFRGLRWPGDLDLPWQFNLVLSRNQADNRFVSRWFTICDEAAWGAPHWRSDLNIGLQGLRKLPEPEASGSGPERRVAAALARFGSLALERGMNRREIESAIRRRRTALTVFYPRHDEHWRDVWADALESVRSRRESFSILAGWLGEVSDRQGVGAAPARGDFRRTAPLPHKARLDQITIEIDNSKSLHDDLWGRVQALIRGHWAYASGSGETYFAVRTTHNLCDRVLRLRPRKPQLTEIHVWTLQAIKAESDNPYPWDLWAKVLSALGQDDTAMSVRWESMRRFPEYCSLRISLTEGLRNHDRIPLAESLLRETMRDFPGNAVCRTMLADLLGHTGREAEAENLLRETMRDFPDNAVCRTMLADLLGRTGREAEAENLLRETMRDFPDNAVCRTMLADLLGRTGREAEAENLLREAIRRFPRNSVCRHMLTVMLWRQGRKEDAKSELGKLETLASDDVYIKSLAKMIAEDRPLNLSYRDGDISLDPAVIRGEEFVASRNRYPGEIGGETATWNQRESRQAEEGRDGRSTLDFDPAILTYLDRLTEQRPLLEACFVRTAAAVTEIAPDPSGPDEARSGSPVGASLAASMPEAPGSAAAFFTELALVAAHRAGRLEGRENEHLRTWVKVRPSSYSARLLLAWRGQEGNGLDREAMSGVAADFPEHRHWNEWLSYPFASEERRRSLRERESSSKGRNGEAFWSGRLSTVYPDLKMEGKIRWGETSYDPAAMRRLLGDVALACADRSLPSISNP